MCGSTSVGVSVCIVCLLKWTPVQCQERECNSKKYSVSRVCSHDHSQCCIIVYEFHVVCYVIMRTLVQ